ncbi:hypothetical protein ABTZ78_17165 [Streptomyces bauhiniae]|uniref:hypothetical protein n=1 Tax=Streptomyces bauhiniae TaxID=2340725 RepID=UPI00332A552E
MTTLKIAIETNDDPPLYDEKSVVHAFDVEGKDGGSPVHPLDGKKYTVLPKVSWESAVAEGRTLCGICLNRKVR